MGALHIMLHEIDQTGRFVAWFLFYGKPKIYTKCKEKMTGSRGIFFKWEGGQRQRERVREKH